VTHLPSTPWVTAARNQYHKGVTQADKRPTQKYLFENKEGIMQYPIMLNNGVTLRCQRFALFFAVLALELALVSAIPAWADTVAWSQPITGNPVGGWQSVSNPSRVLAEDFTLTSSDPVTALRWWGGGSNATQFDVYLYGNGSGNLPNRNARQSLGRLTATRTDTGWNNTWGQRVYRYDVTLSTPLSLTAGATYWLAVVDPGYAWEWQDAGQPGYPPSLRGRNYTAGASSPGASDWNVYWESEQHNLAFEVMQAQSSPPQPQPVTVTINQAAGQADPTSTSPVHFTVVFSASVADFTAADVTLSGTAGAAAAAVTGSGTTYDVAVSGMTGSGTVIVTIPANVVRDAAGNANQASTSTDNSVTYAPTGPSPSLSRASNVLIAKGLQFQSWATTDQSGRTYPSASDFRGNNFTGLTYFEDNLYNATFHRNVPEAQWNMAKAPYPDRNGLGQDPPGADWFSAAQQANASKCVTVCFSDEQPWSKAEEGYLKNWFDVTHQYHPDVLCHTNQFLGQWGNDQLDSYIANAKPDLLTFDNYYFDEKGTTPDYKMAARVMWAINYQVRPRALAGWDGTGNSPIAFGQYLLGFKTGQEQYLTGSYEITESQKYLVANLTWAMGGKWVSVFLWEYDNADWLLMFDSSRRPTHHYYEYAEIARQSRNLGPHLVRLNSTDVRMVPGQHLSGTPVENALPSNVARFTANARYFLSSISAVNLGTQNDGLPQDVAIGYFNPLPGLDTSQFFTSTDPRYFMVVNGLTQGNGLQPQYQDGSCNETQQKITLTFDLSAAGGDPTKLRKVSRDTGQAEPVTLTPVSDFIYELELTLGGGQAELLYWELYEE
jgi:hypothetical protein